MADKVTAPRIRAMKERGEKVVAVTAYDAPFAEMADHASVDIILVGDSVGNTVLGYDSTLPVTLDEIIHHTKAVRRAVKRALLVVDLPFGTYQASTEQAFHSSIALIKAGAEAVKLEGMHDGISGLVAAGIPVMGHVGMTPQSIHQFGGFRIQGKGDSGARIVEQARRLEEQGTFSIVLELIPANLAQDVSSAISIPTIGIGAGAGCDGQVQVMHDLLGLTPHNFRHAKRYVDVRTQAIEAFKQYASEVRAGEFPTKDHSV